MLDLGLLYIRFRYIIFKIFIIFINKKWKSKYEKYSGNQVHIRQGRIHAEHKIEGNA
jgi:hypothetical protein